MGSVKSTSPTVFPGAHILIVDDERGARHSLAGLLRYKGWQVSEASSGPDALALFARQIVDLVILDIKMPGMDGNEVLRRARPQAKETVFIILTAYATLDSAVGAIHYGAFDYLTKPSPVDEIIRTVEAGLRERQRRMHQEDPIALLERAVATIKASSQAGLAPEVGERFLAGPNLQIDVQKSVVVVYGEKVDLTKTEFEILLHLIRNSDRVISCQDLVIQLRGLKLHEPDARIYLRSHMRRLREKLALHSRGIEYITTVRSKGYTFATTPAENSQ